MGMRVFSSCSCSCSSTIPPVRMPNPDPNNFSIHAHFSMGGYVALMVKYPDCTNFEGNKIIVYKDVDLETLLRSRKLDPHFCDEGHSSPIARFIPTETGWENAIEFIKSLAGNM